LAVVVAVAVAVAVAVVGVLELFSGSGNFTFPLASKAAHVTAVEFSHDSIAAARRNMLFNNSNNVSFHYANLITLQDTTIAWLRSLNVNKLVLDPPRSGARQALGTCLHALQSQIERVVYVSCNAESQAQDLHEITRATPYHLRSLQLVDTFPQTLYVATITYNEFDSHFVYYD
jgi:23S rRNA (uracil1939-C5)-methyltransferase